MGDLKLHGKGHLQGSYVDHMTKKLFVTLKYKIKETALIIFMANQKLTWRKHKTNHFLSRLNGP